MPSERECNMIIGKRSRILDAFVYLLLLAAYLAVTLLLFHRQTVNYMGGYPSDIGYYVAEVQGEHRGYFLPYPMLFLVGKFFLFFTTPKHAIAFAVTLLNGLTAVGLKYYLNKYLYVGEQDGIARRIFSSFLTFSLLFVSMLYPLSYLGRYHEPGEGFLYRYLGVFTPNPFHNATYLVAKPFSLMAFFSFAEICTFYEKENKWNHPKYLFFSVSLFLSALAKPSFALVLSAAAGCIMLWRLCKSRFREIKAFFQLGIWFIPTFFLLLYQFGHFFQPEQISGEGIGLGFLTAWSTVTDNVPRALFLAMAFPLTVFLFSFRQKQQGHIFKFSWQFFLASLFTLFFFYEKSAYRLPHLNFAWGYMYGLFFSYVVSLIRLADCSFRKSQPSWQLGIQWGMYGLHLICGVDYFRILLQGGLFH